MVNKKEKNFIFGFFKDQNITKHKGIFVKNMIFQTNSDTFYYNGSKEEFIEKHLEDTFIYIIRNNWDDVFFEEDILLDNLNDDWLDYISDLNDLEHDNLNNIWNDGVILDVLEEYINR
jgi:hypothetical protein